jgi:hypothetical protein
MLVTRIGQLDDPFHAGFKYRGFYIVENRFVAAHGALESDLLPHCSGADDQNFSNVVNIHSPSPQAKNSPPLPTRPRQ